MVEMLMQRVLLKHREAWRQGEHHLALSLTVLGLCCFQAVLQFVQLKILQEKKQGKGKGKRKS